MLDRSAMEYGPTSANIMHVLDALELSNISKQSDNILNNTFSDHSLIGDGYTKIADVMRESGILEIPEFPQADHDTTIKYQQFALKILGSHTIDMFIMVSDIPIDGFIISANDVTDIIAQIINSLRDDLRLNFATYWDCVVGVLHKINENAQNAYDEITRNNRNARDAISQFAEYEKAFADDIATMARDSVIDIEQI